MQANDPKLLAELLRATGSLFEVHPNPKSKSKFLRVLESTYRRNHARLQAIHVLCGESFTAGNALELTRNMAEDLISIEYMIAGGKEELAGKFINYEIVQFYEDLEYSRKLGIKFNNSDYPEAESNIEANYNKLPARLKKRKCWAAKNVEAMLVNLKEEFGSRDLDFIGRVYVEGSRKTHFNPRDFHYWLNPRYFKPASDHALLNAVFSAGVIYVRLTTRYIDEINSEEYRGIAKEVKSLLGNLKPIESEFKTDQES